MKRLYYITVCVLLTIALASCENRIDIDDNNSVDIDVPISGDYIRFCTDVNSRAELVTTLYLEESFGVLCYTYSGTTWGTYESTAKAKPTDALGQGIPTKVEYDAGSYTYGTPVNWESYWYAFFAYAPFDHSKVTPSTSDTYGTPYVTYTLDTADAANHADVMTGYAADCYSAASKDVTFTMHHRLAAVDVAAANYYDYSYDSGSVDGEGNAIYYTEKVTIEIESITAEYTNLRYGSAKIYLNKNIPTEPTALAADITPKYTIVSDYELAPSQNNKFDYISENKSTTMLFIPQDDADPSSTDDDLKVAVTVKYKKKRPDGTYLWTVVESVEEKNVDGETVTKEYKVDVPAGTDTTGIDPNPDAVGTITVLGKDTDGVFTTTQVATFDQALEETFRYYALLTFTSHAVSINILTAAAWDEKPVNYEFD